MVNEPPRKASQEVEIDHLLAEEFACDTGFPSRFLELAGISAAPFVTDRVIPEPGLDGQGFGDLLVEGHAEDMRIALLIEDKITAGPATRQAERYNAHAERLRADGWDQVYTILVAPKGYGGQSRDYDRRINLEDVAEIIMSPSPDRQRYRKAILQRAIEKGRGSGVQTPDERLYEMKKQYLECAHDWCEKTGCPFRFPPLREGYYDGDSWVEPIRHPDLPDQVFLRHRLWTSVKDPRGRVDLIVKRAPASLRETFETHAPKDAIVEPYSNDGVQLAYFLPQMRQDNGFKVEICRDALCRARALVDWYRDVVER